MGVLGGFLCFGLLDIAALLSPFVHIAILALWALGFAAALAFGLRRLVRPASAETDRRLERDSGLSQKAYAKVSLGERVGERARSRLFEMCRVIRMPGVEDYRLRKVGKAH